MSEYLCVKFWFNEWIRDVVSISKRRSNMSSWPFGVSYSVIDWPIFKKTKISLIWLTTFCQICENDWPKILCNITDEKVMVTYWYIYYHLFFSFDIVIFLIVHMYSSSFHCSVIVNNWRSLKTNYLPNIYKPTYLQSRRATFFAPKIIKANHDDVSFWNKHFVTERLDLPMHSTSVVIYGVQERFQEAEVFVDFSHFHFWNWDLSTSKTDIEIIMW